MAEIFVVTADAALAGQYVSDLPVINEAPASRQVGFYLSSLATAYASELSAYLTAKGANFGTPATADALADALIARAVAGQSLDETTAGTAIGGGADYGSGSAEEILRILTGADSAFAETGIIGNGRLIGGKRRIYLRDRTTASLGEGFLRVQVDAGDVVIYLADGSVVA